MRHRKTKIHKGGGIRMKANINRVVSRLEDIYQCGKKEDGTYTRMAFSEEDVKGRELFASWAKRLGMTCHVDEAGNLIAHMDGQDNDLPAIMMGSHLDTVPDGGRYDGVTGCVGGLEVCEVLKEHGKVPKHPIEVIVFTDEEGFRFGFSEKNGQFSNAVEIVRKHSTNTRFGLHLHCNSITRSLDVYKSIAKYAVGLITKYRLDVAYIDIGGGFFGGVEGKPSAEEYISVIKEELEHVVNYEKTQLIIEPGSAIIGSVVDLHTSVLDVKDTDYSRIVTTDGSRIHIDPLWVKERYMYSIEQVKPTEIFAKQIICGYTCMDHDRLMKIENQPELEKGDKIIYHRVGAYSMTFGGMFIRYYPDVYVETEKELIKVRSYNNVQDYLKIHS